MELRMDERGVTIRNVVRTYRFAWPEVSRFADRFVSGLSHVGVRTWVLMIVPHGGRAVTAWATIRAAPDAEMLTDIRQAAERYDLPAELTGSVPAEPPGVAGLYTDPGGQEGVRYWGGGEWSPLLPADLDGDKQVPTFPGKVSGSLPGPDGSWQYAARQAKNETVWSGVFAGATAVCLGIALVGHWGVACRHRVLRTRCIWCLDYAWLLCEARSGGASGSAGRA